jgi:hypothetical protein
MSEPIVFISHNRIKEGKRDALRRYAPETARSFAVPRDSARRCRVRASLRRPDQA